ncbi:MAG: hydantoinase/oxoprolinase family protein [bacterium]|nr:hydantoinase/oxoprolinase family protein [bacterium]
MRIGIDSGGTFTDFAWEGGVLKLPSTPQDPAQAILSGVKQILAANPQIDPRNIEIVHGTTVATNALLTRSGGRVLLLTTAGFEDVIEIGRQDRPELYDLHPTLPPPLVPRNLRIGVNERIAVDGEVQIELHETEIARVVRKVRRLKPNAIAICLLHAYAFPQHERQLAATFSKQLPDTPVFLSSELDPQPREYERTSTTVIHAFLATTVQEYLRELEQRLPGTLSIITSNGGTATAAQASLRPGDLVLSGPAGGVVGAARIAALAGIKNFIGLDMGGTSTDVCLGWGGVVSEDSGHSIEGLPLRVPRLAVHTVGAGGGSIARAGLGGALLVGPESAGADPGSAAFGKGELPTVTDADIVLGRIVTTAFGGIQLNVPKARAAISRLAKELGLTTQVCAEGIVQIADQRMAHAAAEVTQARGYDPQQCVLIPFGGAGPLHACGIAEHLGIRTILIPPTAGVVSAIGASIMQPRRVSIASVMRPLDQWSTADRDRTLSELRRQLSAKMPRPVRLASILYCRYVGQSFELAVPFKPGYSTAQISTRFHREHSRVNGYARTAEPIECVTMLAAAAGGKLVELLHCGEWRNASKKKGKGPLAWSEDTCTVFIAAGWRWALRDYAGVQCLLLEHAG